MSVRWIPAEADTADTGWFDRLAISVAGDVSRRDATKLFVGGAATWIVGSWLRPERAFGASTLALVAPSVECSDVPPGPPCKGTTTFYRTGCANKVTKKAPAKAMFNGCGPENGISAPNSPLGLGDFTLPCNGHDCCYSTCNSNKDKCDSDFYSGMVEKCRSKYGGLGIFTDMIMLQCGRVGELYYQAVSQGGADAHDAAQKARCDCCDDYQCRPTYTMCRGANDEGGGRCCRPDQVCVQGSDGKAHCCDECGPGYHRCATPVDDRSPCGFSCCNDATKLCCTGYKDGVFRLRCCNKCGQPGFCEG